MRPCCTARSSRPIGRATPKRFEAAAEDFLQLMRDMDQLLATRPEFLLGRWLEDAKRWGTTDAERAKFEWNARRVLTLWGTGKAIRDYARKEWSGMISGFYLKRGSGFCENRPRRWPSDKPMDVEAFQQQLCSGKTTGPTAGDVSHRARRATASRWPRDSGPNTATPSSPMLPA